MVRSTLQEGHQGHRLRVRYLHKAQSLLPTTMGWEKMRPRNGMIRRLAPARFNFATTWIFSLDDMDRLGKIRLTWGDDWLRGDLW